MMSADDLQRLRMEALAKAEEGNEERKLALQLIRIGYKELTKFGVSDERARHLKSIRKRLKQSLGRA